MVTYRPPLRAGYRLLRFHGRRPERCSKLGQAPRHLSPQSTMSDTPRTDNACGWPVGHHGRIECGDLRWSPDGPFVHSEVARELERENVALQKQLEQWEQSTQWFAEWTEKKQELERENAALRADNERLDWLFFAPSYRMGLFRKHLNRLIQQKISSDTRDPDEGNVMYRAAMDAARKET